MTTSSQEFRQIPASQEAPAAQPPFFLLLDEEEEVPAATQAPVQQPAGASSVDAAEEAPMVFPFQPSSPLPAAETTQRARTLPLPVPLATSRRPLVRSVLMVGVVLLTVFGASLLVLAQPVPPALSPAPTRALPHHAAATPDAPRQQATPMPTPTPPLATPVPTPTPPVPTPGPTPTQAAANPQPSRGGETRSPQAQGQETTRAVPPAAGGVPSAQDLAHLGWTQAGLSAADALEALEVATTFTQLEMHFDYRNIGSLAQHGGTLIGATALLTPGGLTRFVRYDLRMMNNQLYTMIESKHLIQQVVQAHPALVRIQTVELAGQSHQVAWVDVSFERFQSQMIGGHRTESIEQTTAGQSRLHHLLVVLLRVPPQEQGMPGIATGWRVNTYALDTTTLPALATRPTL